MIAKVIFDGVDVSDWVMRRGVSNLALETQDEDGFNCISSATIKLCNMEGLFDQYYPVTRWFDVEIWLDGNLYFTGYVAPGGVTLNRDDETCEIQAESSEKAILERLKDTQVGSLETVYRYPLPWQQVNILYDSNTQAVYPRWFCPVKDVLKMLFGLVQENHVVFDTTCFDTLLVGGQRCYGTTTVNLPVVGPWTYPDPTKTQVPALPSVTSYDFVKNLIDMFNLILYKDGDDLHIDTYKEHRNASPLSTIAEERGKTKGTTNVPGVDKVTFQWANNGESGVEGPIIVQRDPGAPVAGRTVEIQSIFSAPNAVVGVNGVALWSERYILMGTDNCTYLIQTVQSGLGGWHAYSQLQFTPDYWYLTEFRGVAEFEAVHSFLDDSDSLVPLCAPLARVDNPITSSCSWFVRRAEIDVENETVQLTAQGYN